MQRSRSCWALSIALPRSHPNWLLRVQAVPVSTSRKPLPKSRRWSTTSLARRANAHKAHSTRTCEHPGRSNMDVFVVTHSPRIVNSKRAAKLRPTCGVFFPRQRAPPSSITRHLMTSSHITVRSSISLASMSSLYSDGCRSGPVQRVQRAESTRL